MEFCPKCGAIMLPNDGVLKCNSCGFDKSLSDNNDYEVSGKIKETDNVKMLGDDVDVGPVTNETCPDCGHDKATYKLLQTRSADEAPTRIFTCTKCKHTWRAYDWGFFMKDSKEKEHRISNLKDMITNVKSENPEEDVEEVEEDIELINYLNESPVNYDDLEIDDEFIYHPGDESEYAINLEENPIDEDFIINTPKSEDFDENEENEAEGLNDDFTGELSENIDSLFNAKIGKTPILAIVSTVIGAILIIMGAFLFNSRSDRVIDNVVSGETVFIAIIFAIIGLLLVIYGLYKIIGFKNPVANLMEDINSVDDESEKKTEKKDENKEPENITIPKSKIPLDKDSYKIGEFDMDDLKSQLKKPSATFKPKAMPIEEDIENIPPAREKSEDKKGLTAEEIEEIEYEQVKLDTESIDDIFAEVEDIDEIPIISIDSKEDKKE